MTTLAMVKEWLRVLTLPRVASWCVVTFLPWGILNYYAYCGHAARRLCGPPGLARPEDGVIGAGVFAVFRAVIFIANFNDIKAANK